MLDGRRRRATARVRASRSLKEGWVKPNKRIFDNTKISDHFAIIPTLQAPKSLSEIEAKLYDLVVQALPRGVLPGGRIPGHDAHHARSAGAPASRPKARCWSSPAGSRSTARKRRRRRGRRNLVAGAAGREGAHRERSTPTALEDQAAARATTKRRCSSAMEGAGKLDRRRRAARGDAREGPGHAGHARRDHRRPDQREVHLARRPRADPDRRRRSS